MPQSIWSIVLVRWELRLLARQRGCFLGFLVPPHHTLLGEREGFYIILMQGELERIPIGFFLKETKVEGSEPPVPSEGAYTTHKSYDFRSSYISAI